jgi:methylenetetrahydrofolate dehydrogenase (NADP+) / methenyltetrahydrofolate cyclohydrolase
MIIFDGNAFAQTKEQKLKEQVAELAKKNRHLAVAAIVFSEDEGSLLYTGLKHEAARRVGIGYSVYYFSVNDSVENILERIELLNQDQAVTGIIIQKPWRKTWLAARQDGTAAAILAPANPAAFQNWWLSLTQAIDPNKDVDGLHPTTLETIKQGSWQEQGRVLPATCRAVIDILREARRQLLSIDQPLPENPHYVILGTSDLLGQPLAAYLQAQGEPHVDLIGRTGLQGRVESGLSLLDADVVVAATGSRHLVTGSMIKPGAVVIDVGEPRPDVEAVSVATKASFLTPVPGGVGPMTVISLLENCYQLAVK